MTIIDPDHQFRLTMVLWGGNYRGEQPFTSAPQRNLLDVITLVKEMKANRAINSQVRSYVIQEQFLSKTEFGNHRWETLDYSDWSDL